MRKLSRDARHERRVQVIRLLTIGQHPSAPVEHFGIQLVAVRKGGKLPPAP